MQSLSLLNPKLDLVFKILFGRIENRELLISLVSAVLNPPIPISSVDVLDPEMPRGGVDERGIVLDLRVRLDDGRQVNVEMQAQLRPAQRERAVYHFARMYGSQLVRGEDYRDLRGCVVIFLCDFAADASDRFHSVFRFTEIHDRSTLSEQAEIHFVELPRLAQDPTAKHERFLSAWAKFLSASDEHDFDELSKVDPIFRKATMALKALSEDAKLRLLAERREAELLFQEYERNVARREAQEEGRREGLEEGRREGLQEGRREGLQQGMTDLLLKLLAQKFGEVPNTVRARVEHASESDLVEWARRVLVEPTLTAVFRE
ncbi:MAG TPA: Rpn family recombination-promoting nuclease/putative transposase [Polyangiaceae bacterium]|nr:Rpn family recombination-promoting nuclease/putative transposase [Polyangiaceae bacterium]